MKSKTFLFCLSLLVLGLCLLPAGICSELLADAPARQFSMIETVDHACPGILVADQGGWLGDIAAVLTMIGLGMAFTTKDNKLKNTKALPNGAVTVSGDGFDLGHGSRGDFVANCELQIEAPILTGAELPDGQTIIYHVYHSDNSDFSGESLLYGNVLTQTGAGGTGAPADTKNVRLPVDVKSYVREKAVKTGAANASTKSMTTRLVF